MTRNSRGFEETEDLNKLVEKAKQLSWAGNWDLEAIQTNSRILELVSNEDELFGAYFRRGTCYLKQARVDEAERDFREALVLKPNYKLALERIRETHELRVRLQEKRERQASFIEAINKPRPINRPRYRGYIDGYDEYGRDLESELHRTGYSIRDGSRRRSRSERWRILTTRSLPKLGLQQVAHTIAMHIRRKRISRTEETFAHAIGEWEHDLNRLKEELFDGSWRWPSTDPNDYWR